MNILLISRWEPYVNQTGAMQRTTFLHEALSSLGTVYTVVPLEQVGVKEVCENARIMKISLHARKSFSWFLWRVWKEFFSMIALPCFSRKVRNSIFPGVRFDCVVVRYTSAAAELKAWTIAPCFLDIDDYPSEVFETMVSGKCSSVKRFFYRNGVKIWSKWVFSHCIGGWIANREQLVFLDRKKFTYLPNVALPAKADFRFFAQSENFLLTVGFLGYAANYEGIDFFLKNSWPAINREMPDLKYMIAGKGCPEEMKKNWETYKNVVVLGFVDDLDSLYEHCLATVCPIYSGSGTCIKVIESLLRGRVCVASRFAVRGWPDAWLLPENGIFVSDSASEMTAAVLTVCAQSEQLRKSAENFKEFAFQSFGYGGFQNAVKERMMAL